MNNNDMQFVEQLVEKKPTQADFLFRIAMFIAAGIISVVAYALLDVYGTLFAAGAFYLAWRLSTRRNIEYEYAVTEGELDVDIIFARRSRKKMVSLKAKELESFGVMDNSNKSEYESGNIKKKFWACSGQSDSTVYFCVFHLNNVGKSVLFFEPNSEVYKAMRLYNPHKIKQI